MNNFRINFTLFWENLSGKAKSLIISVAAVVIASLLLTIAKWVFPSADFGQTELVVTTAISGLIASVVKDFIKG